MVGDVKQQAGDMVVDDMEWWAVVVRDNERISKAWCDLGTVIPISSFEPHVCAWAKQKPATGDTRMHFMATAMKWMTK